MIEEIKNIQKIEDGLYKYDLIKTETIQTNLEALNHKKNELEKRLANINHLLSEIEKLKI